MSQKTITINGTVYDARTGLPINTSEADVVQVTVKHKVDAKKPRQSHEVHSVTQKSHTLNRRTVAKSASSPTKIQVHQAGAKAQKSQMITRFAPHPTGTTAPAHQKNHKVVSDFGPSVHPVARKAHQAQPIQPARQTQSQLQPASLAPKPSQIIKREAIAQAMEKASTKNNKKAKRAHRSPRLVSILSGSFALLLLGGYFTYLNMPNLETRVAAAQAGVNASYPSYHPDGYSLSGALAWQPGKVSMKFASNSGPRNFTVVQQKSNYDSTAVKENYAIPKWGKAVSTDTSHGITIYSKDGDAAWVNGGVLYTIDGDAPLTNDQIRRIAASL